MSYVLRVAGAGFTPGAVPAVAPFSLELEAGQRADVRQFGASRASIAARLCAGIVKPSTGAVYICDYDTRLQPAQAKQRTGYVDISGLGGTALRFAREVALRSAIWSVDRARALDRIATVFKALGDDCSPYARGTALALIPDILLLVLDQPPAGVFQKICALRPDLAIVVTQELDLPAQIDANSPEGAVAIGRR